MAFDAAASGEGRASRAGGPAALSPRGDTEAAVALASQRLTGLVQLISSIERLVEQVGTSSDTVALRGRLSAAESKAEAVRTELDAVMRKLRVDSMNVTSLSDSGGGGGTARSVDRLHDQYADVRRRLVDILQRSHGLRRTHAPATDDGSAVSANPLRNVRPANGDVLEMATMRALDDDVDAAIVEERRQEAQAIAHEAVEVHGAMKDLSTLVNEQGERLEVVEDQVTDARDVTIRANKDLTVAAQYQRSYRCKCVLFLICILILLTCVVVPVVVYWPQISGN